MYQDFEIEYVSHINCISIIYAKLGKHVPLTTSRYYFVGTTHEKLYQPYCDNNYYSTTSWRFKSVESYFSHPQLKNVAENNIFSENVSFNTKKTHIGNKVKVSALFVILIDNNCVFFIHIFFPAQFYTEKKLQSNESQLTTRNSK